MSDDCMSRKLFANGLAGIVFDCDGVMIDSLEANRDFYNIILKALDLPPMTPEQESFAFMSTAEEALRRMVPETLHDAIPETTRKNLNYERDILPQIKLMPGFRGFLELAHAKGLKLGIDTNRTDYSVGLLLKKFGFSDWFKPVATSSRVEPKPSPEGLLWISEEWGAKPDRCLFIGDSEDDWRAAEAAGTAFIGFGNWPGERRFPVARDYQRLAEMLFGEMLTTSKNA